MTAVQYCAVTGHGSSISVSHDQNIDNRGTGVRAEKPHVADILNESVL